MSQELDETQESMILPGEDPESISSSRAEELEGWIPSGMWFKQGTLFPAKPDAKFRVSKETVKLIRLLMYEPSFFHEELSESLPRHHAGTEEKEAREKQIEILRAERDKLASQNELLVSRVAEHRRTAARETQRFDQLQRQCANLQQTIDKLVDSLNERGRANDCLLSCFISRPDSHIRMSQSYEGVVEDVDGDRAVVVFDVDGKIVEQTYEKSQFNDHRLPEAGSRLAVYVIVAEVQPKLIQAGIEELDPSDESASPRRKSLSGPTEF